MTPRIKEQIKQLRQISYGAIKNKSAVIVECSIKDLSPKDLARCLAVSTTAFTEISRKQQIIQKVTKKLIEETEKIFNDDKLSDSEKLSELKKILSDSDLEDEHLSIQPSDVEKEP